MPKQKPGDLLPLQYADGTTIRRCDLVVISNCIWIVVLAHHNQIGLCRTNTLESHKVNYKKLKNKINLYEHAYCLSMVKQCDVHHWKQLLFNIDPNAIANAVDKKASTLLKLDSSTQQCYFKLFEMRYGHFSVGPRLAAILDRSIAILEDGLVADALTTH